MSELSVRETAAWAVREAIRLNERATWLDTADAALAAAADHDGLAGVLAGALMQPTRAPLNQHDPETGDCVSCPWPVHALPAPDIAAHLADVVRAWLRGTT